MANHNESEAPMGTAIGRQAVPNIGKPRYGIKLGPNFIKSLISLIVQTIRNEIRRAFNKTVFQDVAAQLVKVALTPAEVARYYGIPEQTLANWRCRKVGPQFVKAEGKKILYRRKDIEDWLERHKVLTNQTVW